MLWLTAPPSAAPAELKRYDVLRDVISQVSITSPELELLPHEGPPGVAVLEAGRAAPVLRRLVIVEDDTGTADVPLLGGQIFLSNHWSQGPRGSFTGAGRAETSIAWGIVTGWTATGAFWCNSAPSLVCSLAGGADEETVPVAIESSFYDLGTWTFHGTGFTASPFTERLEEGGGGNAQWRLRGRVTRGGRVPALPVVGLVLLAGALALARQAGGRSR
jgi:hypothetical protein